MNFNLKDAGEKSSISYQRTGIFENVQVTSVLLEKSSQKQVPYIKLVTKGPDGEVGQSNKMFLSTTVGEGKKTSAWAITARNLVDLIVATHNCSEDEAKAMIAVESETQLVNKVSALLIGKPFRAKFKGEEGNKGNGVIFASLAQVESMKVPASETALRYSDMKDIKRYEGPAISTGPVTTNTLPEADLPF